MPQKDRASLTPLRAKQQLVDLKQIFSMGWRPKWTGTRFLRLLKAAATLLLAYYYATKAKHRLRAGVRQKETEGRPCKLDDEAVQGPCRWQLEGAEQGSQKSLETDLQWP